MTSRGEDATSEFQDFQLGSSWIPITPSKPGQRDQQPVCTKWQENHPVLSAPVNLDHLVTQANVCEPTTLAEHFLQEFDIWQAGAAAKTHVYDKFSPSELDQWTNISFKGLLALAESKSNTAAIANAHAYHDFATSSSFGPDYCMSFGNSAGQDQGSLLGANLNAEFEVPNFVTDENSISSRHFFDLNSPATMTAAAASQFEPITPEKTNRAEYMQESILKDFSIDEMPAEKGKDLNGVVTLHKDKVKSQLVNDQLCGATSTQLQENHKPDNEGAEEANLSKTPQQKTRRRKHRPKVIIEGQKKSTPKSSAKKPTSPQEPGVKKKYVRKKGVNNLIGGETNGTDSVNKTPNSTVTPEGKRKYTRRRKIDTPEDDMDNGTTGITDIKATPYTQRSCRRSLNFDLDGPERDGRATYCPSSSCNKESQEMEVMLRRNDMVPSQQPSERPTPSINMDTLKNNHMFTDQIMCSRGKCQIVFSDVTHDKEMNNVQVTPKSRSDSITCLTPEKQDQGLKRKSINTPFEAELSNRNETGAYYNSMQAYLPMFLQNADKNNGTPGLHFPPIHKKKRIENVYSAVTSSIQIRDSSTSLFTPPTNQGYCAGLGQQNNNFLTNNHATYGTQDGRQLFGDLLALGPAQRIKKRRSKGPTCQWDLASLVEELPASRGYTATASRIKQHTKILQEPPTCMGTRVSDTCSTILTKKRSHRSMVINSTVQNLYNNHKFATTSIGPPLALTWDIASPVDSITEQLNQLDLNAKSSLASERKCSALMAHRGYYQEQHAIIQFQNPAAIVPFNSSFDQVRRRRPRPKVDLDHETDRVWRLLLENINNEGIDGTDEEKAKWWEEERRVFRGRTDSFIARMHLVQGDRRFSPWKGSVVDSVVGVFLTQNVADHLSSSAFMSMVSRYPSKSNPHPAELHEEKFTTEINEPELDSVRTFRLSKEILTKSAGGKGTNMIQEFKDDSIREVNSVKSSGNTFDVFIPEDNLRGQSTDVSIHGPATSSEIATNKSISLTDDGRDTEDTLSSQNSTNSPIAQTTERSDSYFLSTSEDEPTVGVNPNRITKSTSSAKILQMASTVSLGAYVKSSKQKTTDENHQVQSESSASNLQIEDHLVNPTFPAKNIASCSQSTLCRVTNSGTQTTEFDLSEKKKKTSDTSSNEERFAAEASDLSSESASGITCLETTSVSFEEARKTLGPNTHYSMNTAIEVNGDVVGNQTGQAPAKNEMQGISKCPNSNKNGLYDNASNTVNEPKAKGGRPRKEKENQVDWDHFRKQTLLDGRKRTRPANTLDSVDWEAVRCTDVSEIAETIKERGMNNVLAQRIQDFLNRIVRDHGSIDLEWLRDIPPDKAKEYLLSIRGLGLKSVECVRLLTLHHLAFPVDTNVGRIAVRLGWVPLQPLPESLQLHLLELYPVLESIQKYLWPRLCKLDQKTLYELHYQMITFGKVFCTKSKPNCNACPLRAECRHFASAFASARLALPAPQEKSIVSATENRKYDQNPVRNMNALKLPSPPFVSATENRKYYQNPVRNMNALQLPSPPSNETDCKSGVVNSGPIIEEPPSPEPIIEVPATPEPDHIQVPECDIEDAFDEDLDEIPTIQLNIEEFTHNLQTIMQQNTELQGGDMSKALVALASEAASIPVPKLKNVNHLRTEHQVYELPDSHPLLEGMDKREPDDPCPYLLAIWTPGETMDSIEPPERQCSSQGFDKLCSDETCSSCNSIREANSQTVRGTILIPCRTAMRGSFPLNGTYFQVNEVFSDHESSLSPIYVPREWLWNLPRRTVYFGTSIPSIFKGLSTEGIQYCFWRGFVCVRGFDRRMRAPRPLIARLHFPASRLPRRKGKGKIDESNA